MQRRETERQTEQRLTSYAYISQQEADEKWKHLKCSSADSEVAAKVWDKLTTPNEHAAVPDNLSRSAYLATLIPGSEHCAAQTSMMKRCASSQLRYQTLHDYVHCAMLLNLYGTTAKHIAPTICT